MGFSPRRIESPSGGKVALHFKKPDLPISPTRFLDNLQAPKNMKPQQISRISFPLAAAIAALLASGASANAQTQNYFGTTGTLSGNVWSTNLAGPYTSALDSTGGAIINFGNAAPSITGASIIVAGINATANATFSAVGGTISNEGDAVIPIDVATGTTLDFSTQSFTSSATAGYTKTGAGVVALAGNTYGGGFTLNAGTIILRGINAMGAGGTLTINGGTIAGNATRDLSGKYAGGIAIGGDFTFGATTGLAVSNANLTFNNNVNLGAATRMITIGGTGAYTLGGVISSPGSAGLTVGATASGTLALSGTNTYTGGTNVNAGTLVFLNTNAKEPTGTHAFAAGATLGLGVGGAGFFSATDVTNAFAGTMTGNLSNVTVTSTTNVGIDTSAGNFTYSTNVAGSPTRGLVKTGANTLVLSGNNTYTGGFTLNAGTVEFSPSGGAYTGFGTGTLTINGGTIRTAANAQFSTANNSIWNASFSLDRGTTGTREWTHNGTVMLGGNVTISSVGSTFNTIVNGVISETGGSRSITLAGNGAILTLNNANTFSGGVNAGAYLVNINNNGSGGTSSAIGTGTLTINGGTINNTSGSAVTLSTNNAFAVNGNFTFTGSNALSFGSGLVTLNGTRTFTINGSTLTIGGLTASGAHGIVKAGAGKLVITGSNGTTGNNTINANSGVLNIRNNGSLGSGSLTLVNSGAALEFEGGLTGVNEALSLNGTGVSNGGALRNISGDNTLTGLATLFSATRINSDSGTLTLDRASGNAVTGTFNLTFGGAGNITVADPIATATGTLTKDGNGTLTLSAANTYTGTTTVTAGTLKLGANNALQDASNVSIGAATLDVDTRTDTAGTLDVTGAATINLGSGAAFAFADSKAVDWTGGTLNITGTLGATSLRFGDSADDLDTAQLAVISVNNSGLGTYILDASGYLVAGGGGPGPVNNFLISAISSPQTVGTPITGITITARDSSNATATSFTGTVTFGGTGGFSGTSASFTAGVLSGVSVTPTVAGSNLTFTVDDGASHTGSVTITTIQTQYQAWSGGAAFNADANNDGVKNGMAFLLGAASPTSAITMPTFTQSSGNLTLNFSMRNSANRGAASLTLQHSGDLGISDPWASALVPVNGSGVTFSVTPGSPLDSVTATISNSQAVAGKLFGRLQANE
jgi:autotransporter-associated beta strand protein